MFYAEFVNDVKIICGKGAVAKIGEELRGLGVESPLLVTGPVLNKIGAVAKLIAAADDSGADIEAVFADVPNDSSADVVAELVNIYDNNSCDGIVALGGGSVLDTAKGLKLLLESMSDDLMKMRGIESAERARRIPFIAIPTTAGTGSEVTKVAVIAADGTKMEFISEGLLPDVAILDPAFTLTLPPKATVTGAFDALTHAIEAYTGVQSNAVADSYALAAIDRIRENLANCVKHGDNEDYRAGMLEASTLAGIAFSNSMVGAVHAIGHAVGGLFHVPHDNAMMMLLPETMEFNMDKCADKYASLLYHVAGGDVYAETPPDRRAEMTVEYLREQRDIFAKELGIKLRLSDFGIEEKDIPLIARAALHDGAVMANVKEMTEADAAVILRKVL